MKKKTKKILIAVGSVLGALIIAAGIFYSVITIKFNKERAEAEEQMRRIEQLAVEDRAVPIAEEYGVTDLTIASLKDDHGNILHSAICYFTSEQFGALSDRDKLLLLVDLASEFYKDKYVFPEQSPLYGCMIKMYLKYNGDSYEQATLDGRSYLLVNGHVNKKVYADTQYAKMVEANVERLMNTDAYGNTTSRSSGRTGTGLPCPVCNGTGFVRYYSANSALESFLEGVPAYTSGECPSCKGTGKR